MPKQTKLFRRVKLSAKMVEHGFPKPAKGHAWEKVQGREIYRQVHAKTGVPLKHKGRTRLFGGFFSKGSSWRHYTAKFPQFPVRLEGMSKYVDLSESSVRKAIKAKRAGRRKLPIEYATPLTRLKPKELWESKAEPFIISKSVSWKAGKKTLTAPVHEMKKIPAKPLKFHFTMSDGTVQSSKKFEKRSAHEIGQFKAAKVQGTGTAYRPGVHAKVVPIHRATLELGPGRPITSTRSLVSTALGKRSFKGTIQLAYDWRIFEGVGSAKELKGKSGADFKFNVKKASKAFMPAYRRYLKEHLSDALVKRNPKLAKWSTPESIIKHSRVSKKTRARMVRDLKRQGKIPMSALALFVETKILELAKLRGVVVSAGKAFKDFKGLKSQKDEGWQGTFDFNVYKAGK